MCHNPGSVAAIVQRFWSPMNRESLIELYWAINTICTCTCIMCTMYVHVHIEYYKLAYQLFISAGRFFMKPHSGWWNLLGFLSLGNEYGNAYALVLYHWPCLNSSALCTFTICIIIVFQDFFLFWRDQNPSNICLNITLCHSHINISP